MKKLDNTTSARGYDRVDLSLKAIGAGLWDYDIEADSLYCSDRWYEIIGLSGESDPVRSVADLSAHIHQDDVKAATEVDLNHVASLLANDEKYHIEFRIVRPSGEIRWVRSVACILQDDEQHLRAVGCITDITDFRACGLESEQAVASMTEASRRSSQRLSGGHHRTKEAGFDLSNRELECLLWVSLGKTAWETASILELSQRTVEFHLKNWGVSPSHT